MVISGFIVEWRTNFYIQCCFFPCSFLTYLRVEKKIKKKTRNIFFIFKNHTFFRSNRVRMRKKTFFLRFNKFNVFVLYYLLTFYILVSIRNKKILIKFLITSFCLKFRTILFSFFKCLLIYWNTPAIRLSNTKKNCNKTPSPHISFHWYAPLVKI